MSLNQARAKASLKASWSFLNFSLIARNSGSRFSAMEDRVPLLHPAVASPAEDDPLPDQHAADRDAAFGQTRSRL